MPSKSICVVTMARLPSFWWLNSIPCVFLYMCIYINIPCVFICTCMVGSSDKTWPTREENGQPLQYHCLENHTNSMKRQKDGKLKDELPRSVGAQYATGEEWRNNYRKNEEMEPKQKQHPVVDVTSDGSKVWCCKEQYCIWTWNIRFMNQGKLEVVWQEMARVNIDILGITELKWTGMGKFN